MGSLRQASHRSRAAGANISSAGRPCCMAKVSAPGPAKMRWGLFSITNRAAAAARRTWVRAMALPCSAGDRMTNASSETPPLASGRPPYPTESTSGSASTASATCMAASSGSAPGPNRAKADSCSGREKDQVLSKSDIARIIGRTRRLSGWLNRIPTFTTCCSALAWPSRRGSHWSPSPAALGCLPSCC